MSASDHSKILWITRSQPFGLRIARECGNEGIRAFAVPLLQVMPLSASPLERVPDAIIFTIRQGVRTHRFDASFRDVPVLTVGDATAAEAMAKGYSAVQSAGGDVDDLKVLTKATVPRGSRIALFGARNLAGDLESDLGRSFYRVDRSIVYETRASTDRELKNATDLLNRVQGICVYSPKGAERLSSVLAARRWSGSLYCLSRACADRIGSHEEITIEIADRPTDRSLRQLVRRRLGLS